MSSIQHTLVAILLEKYQYAVELYDVPCIALAGGIREFALRAAIQDFAQSKSIQVALPPITLCTTMLVW